MARFFPPRPARAGALKVRRRGGTRGTTTTTTRRTSTASVNKHEWRDWINKRVSGKEYLAKQAGVDLGVPFLPDPAVSTGGRAGGSGPRLTRDELSDDVASLFFFPRSLCPENWNENRARGGRGFEEGRLREGLWQGTGVASSSGGISTRWPPSRGRTSPRSTSRSWRS